MWANQSRAHTLNRLHYPPALITPGLGTGQLKTAPVPQSPRKWFKLANPKRAHPASPVPSLRNYHEASRPLSSLAPSASCPTLVPPPVPTHLPGWHAYSLLLGTVSDTLSFQWQSSPHLLASPDLKNTKIYILKCTHTNLLNDSYKWSSLYLQGTWYIIITRSYGVLGLTINNCTILKICG